MQIMRLDRSDERFYALMGPIFGSRAVEKACRDRFYDDPGKRWYLIPGRGAASILEGTIKNFWADDGEAAAALIGAVLQDCDPVRGILSDAHESVFRALNFRVERYRKHFIEVYHERD